VIYWCVSGKKC